MYRRKVWFVCLAMFIAWNVGADPTVQVRNLAYGEALFHFYKQDYLMSGVRLLMAKERQQLGENGKDAELLLAGLQLSYGLYDAASETLERVLSDEIDPQTRNRAWYFLARSAYQRGDLEKAQAALARISGEQAPESAAQRRLLESLVALAGGEPERAVEVLATASEETALTPYLRYNLAIARLRTQQREQGLALLEQLGEEKARTSEQLAIRDRANLAAAFSLLQAEEPERALNFFQRVRLQEEDARLALLGAGWAAAEKKDFDLALRFWGELVTRRPRDNAVLEALFAVPFVYVQKGDPARAVARYEQAISAYLEERERLRETKRKVEDGLLFEDLLRRIEGRALPVVPALRDLHLPDLIASHPFQEAWKTYRDLDQLHRGLQHWQQSLAAFDTMLAARKARFDKVVPLIERRLQEIDAKSLRDRETQLRATLDRVGKKGEVWRLATSEERALADEMRSIEARLARLPPSEERQEIGERFERIKGVLYWQVHAAFPVRLWEMTKRVRSVEQERQRMDARLETLGNARRFANRRLGDLASRVQLNRSRVKSLLPRTERLLARQKSHLVGITLRALNERQAYLESYLLQSRYALAQLYDKAQSEVKSQ
ncbi:MAG: hypothetical protein Kow006_26870 [Gammaproteobacteria bacterium]